MTTDELENLLVHKAKTKMAWDEAYKNANRLSSLDDPAERLRLDLICKEAMLEYCAAEHAYESALADYIKAKKK